MFRFCANIALVRRRQTTVAITFLVRIQSSPVIPKSNQPQTNGCQFLAFHDYSPQLSTYKRKLPIHFFLPAIASRDSNHVVKSQSPCPFSVSGAKKNFAFRHFFLASEIT